MLNENAKGDPDCKIKKIIFEVRQEFEKVYRNADNAYFKSKYVTLDNVLKIIEGPFLNHGLFLSNSFLNTDRGSFLVVTITHVDSGDFLKAEVPLLLGKNEMQPLGSAITYARRYGLCALLNICIDEDDDGNATSSNQPKQQQSTPPKVNTQAPKNNNYQTQTPPKTIPPQALSAVDQIKNLFNSLDDERRKIAEWYYRQTIEEAKANKLTNKEMETLYNNINGIKYAHLDDLYSGMNRTK